MSTFAPWDVYVIRPRSCHQLQVLLATVLFRHYVTDEVLQFLGIASVVDWISLAEVVMFLFELLDIGNCFFGSANLYESWVFLIAVWYQSSQSSRKNAKLPTCSQRVIWYSQNEQRLVFFSMPEGWWHLLHCGHQWHTSNCRSFGVVVAMVVCAYLVFCWERTPWIRVANFQETLAMIRKFTDAPSVSFRVLFGVDRCLLRMVMMLIDQTVSFMSQFPFALQHGRC